MLCIGEEEEEARSKWFDKESDQTTRCGNIRPQERVQYIVYIKGKETNQVLDDDDYVDDIDVI